MMNRVLAVVAVAFLTAAAGAEDLLVTFGAASDLTATYGKHDLTGNVKQNTDIAAPHFTIGGLDLDGHGANDDLIAVEITVTATGGNVARLAQGYRLDAKQTLTCEIVSATMKLGTGEALPLDAGFVSANPC